MDYTQYVQVALTLVDAWEVPEEDFARIVNEQAQLMCGLNLEPPADLSSCCPYADLQF